MCSSIQKQFIITTVLIQCNLHSQTKQKYLRNLWIEMLLVEEEFKKCNNVYPARFLINGFFWFHFLIVGSLKTIFYLIGRIRLLKGNVTKQKTAVFYILVCWVILEENVHQNLIMKIEGAVAKWKMEEDLENRQNFIVCLKLIVKIWHYISYKII